MPSIRKCGFCSQFVPLGSPIIEALSGGIIRFCSAECFLAYCDRESVQYKHDPEWDSMCNKAIEKGLQENPELTLENASDAQILSWVSMYGRPGNGNYSPEPKKIDH